MVGSIETVFAGEINAPTQSSRTVREIAAGVGRGFAKGEELGRFNMGSTVILVLANPAVHLVAGLQPGATVRLGQAIAYG